MTTTINMGESPNVLRDVIEAWAADREPPLLRDDTGRYESLEAWLKPTLAELMVDNQLDSASTGLFESIVNEEALEHFDGTECGAAGLLYEELMSA